MMFAILFCLLAPPVDLPQPRYMTEEQEKAIRQSLPRTDDEKLQSVFSKPLAFYTHKELPRVFQHHGVGSPDVAILTADYNIAGAEDIAGAAPREYPWAATAGLTVSDPVIKFLWLPPQGKITVRREQRSYYTNVTEQVFRATYPPGTIHGELLLVPAKAGGHRVFEVRTWTKSQNGDSWSPNVYAPFKDEQDLLRIVQEEAGAQAADTVALRQHLSNRERFTLRSFLSRHGRADRTVPEDHLPRLSESLCDRILTKRPFRSLLGTYWAKDSQGRECASPTTTFDFQLVPKGYGGAMRHASKKSCIECHQDSTRYVRDISDNGIKWYGFAPGSGDITLGHHVFDPACIVYNGGYRPVQFDKRLTEIGRLEIVGQ